MYIIHVYLCIYIHIFVSHKSDIYRPSSNIHMGGFRKEGYPNMAGLFSGTSI